MSEFIELKQSMVIPRIRHEILTWQSEGFTEPDFISVGPEEAMSLYIEMTDMARFDQSQPDNWDGIKIAGVKIIHSDRSGIWAHWISHHVARKLAWHRENWRKK